MHTAHSSSVLFFVVNFEHLIIFLISFFHFLRQHQKKLGRSAFVEQVDFKRSRVAYKKLRYAKVSCEYMLPKSCLKIQIVSLNEFGKRKMLTTCHGMNSTRSKELHSFILCSNIEYFRRSETTNYSASKEEVGNFVINIFPVDKTQIFCYLDFLSRKENGFFFFQGKGHFNSSLPLPSA